MTQQQKKHASRPEAPEVEIEAPQEREGVPAALTEAVLAEIDEVLAEQEAEAFKAKLKDVQFAGKRRGGCDETNSIRVPNDFVPMLLESGFSPCGGCF